MLARMHKAMEKRDEGFTLIELLVVIIIIGILAAIAIPVFLNQRKKGYDAASKAELNNISLVEESYATANNGKYTADVAGALKNEGYNMSTPYRGAGGSVGISVNGASDVFCAVVVNSAAPTVPWAQSSTTGAPAKGTCAAAGVFTPAP